MNLNVQSEAARLRQVKISNIRRERDMDLHGRNLLRGTSLTAAEFPGLVDLGDQVMAATAGGLL